MPYIERTRRSQLNQVERFYSPATIPINAGELNFIITKLVHDYIESKGLRYQNINDAIGVLECAKLELYRMVASPYENMKIQETGFVSQLDRELNGK